MWAVIGTVLLSQTASPIVAAAADVPPQRRPNVLFVAVDDLNDWIGCLRGHPDAKTPHMDRLARRGVLFTRAYCAAPACNPSRVALLTGLRPSTTGVYHNDQPWRTVPVLRNAVTLPQHFMANGYHVVGCGKIFHGGLDEPASWHEYRRPARGAADRDPNRPARLPPPSGRAGGITWGALDVSDEEMEDHHIVSWAIEKLRRRTDDRPLFLACGLHKPHMPWQVPKKYFDLYPLESIRLPEAPEDDLKDVPPAGVAIARPEGDHANVLRTNTWRQAVQAYLASISFADAQVGRLLEALDTDPALRDNTIIVLWGDHGWHLGEKKHWRKFALWEEATRTPLIVAGPGVAAGEGAGARCERAVSLLDLYPTLADLCSLPAGEALEGRSLRALLRDPRAAWDHAALTTHGRGNHAVRTERWRYIRYAGSGEELYDHDSDPNEWTNLAADEKWAEVKADLAKRLPPRDAQDAPRRAGARRARQRN
jgi:arylsulfatase A-like enzyme